jgi:hypothetical protein
METYQEDLGTSFKMTENRGFFVFQPQARVDFDRRVNGPRVDRELRDAFEGGILEAQELFRTHRPLPGCFPFRQTDKVHLRVAGGKVGEACDAMMPVIIAAAREHPDMLVEFKVANEDDLRGQGERAERILQQAQITIYAWENVEKKSDGDSEAFCKIIADITDRLRMMDIGTSEHSCAESDLSVNEYFSFRQDRDDQSGDYLDPSEMSGRELVEFRQQMERRPLFAELLESEGVAGAMPEFSQKEWRKTRPDSLKDSGIAKGIKRFNKTCQQKASRLFDADEIQDYLDAIQTMADAIDAARAKTKTKSSHDAVKALLADWSQRLDDYRREVEAAQILVERFEFDRASDEIQKMTQDDYRVQSSLG